jgi:hypothetical protein
MRKPAKNRCDYEQNNYVTLIYSPVTTLKKGGKGKGKVVPVLN